MTELIKTVLAVALTNGAMFCGIWFVFFRERLATKDAQIEHLKAMTAPNLVGEVEKLSKFCDSLQSRVNEHAVRVKTLEKRKVVTKIVVEAQKKQANAKGSIFGLQRVAALLDEWATELDSDLNKTHALLKDYRSVRDIGKEMYEYADAVLAEVDLLLPEAERLVEEPSEKADE